MSFPTATPVVAGDFGRASWADAVVDDLKALALAEFDLGGSIDQGITGTAQTAAVNQKRVRTFHADYTDNFVWTIIVWMQVGSGGSVTAEVKDDLGTVVHTFTAHTSTSLLAQRYAFTPDPAREYLLYFTNTNDPVIAVGYGKIIRSAATLPS